MIEDAKANNRILWILLQDIKHVFDSISHDLLEKTLKRIRIPDPLITIIMDLVNNWQIWIDTYYGPTDTIHLKRGINQGDCIFPLLWIIFYKPLLKWINKETKRYVMKTRVTPDLRYTYETFMQRHGVHWRFYLDRIITDANGTKNFDCRIFLFDEWYYNESW